MAIAHTNHVRQSTLTEYILQNFKYSVDWGLGIGDWGLGTGDWGLGTKYL
ncbi:MAG: hypothetical protein V7L11_16255 [Nostoc sp.]